MDERERLIRAHLPMVRRIAKRIARFVPSVDLDDLIGDGCVGLIQAIDGYDPSYGTTVEQYARRLALGKMLNGVRRMDYVSERARRELREAERDRYRTAAERGTLPTNAELERTRPRFASARLQAHLAVPLSLDVKLPDELEPPLDWESNPALALERRSRTDELQRMVATLPQRQRQVIAMYYRDGLTLNDVGKTFGITSQRASQLHLAAIANLRKAYGAAR